MESGAMSKFIKLACPACGTVCFEPKPGPSEMKCANGCTNSPISEWISSGKASKTKPAGWVVIAAYKAQCAARRAKAEKIKARTVFFESDVTWLPIGGR